MKKQHFSKKREAILNTIQSTKSHPSAEWVYNQLKPTYPDLSLGTVYRNIAFFKKNGNIISVGHVKGHERFDADTSNHAHFICSNCGCVLDVDPNIYSVNIDSDILESFNLTIDSNEIIFHGICKNCI